MNVPKFVPFDDEYSLDPWPAHTRKMREVKLVFPRVPDVIWREFMEKQNGRQTRSKENL